MIHQSDWTPALLFCSVSDGNESVLILDSKLYLAIGMIAILPGVNSVHVCLYLTPLHPRLN